MNTCETCKNLKKSPPGPYSYYCDLLSGFDLRKPACSADLEDLSAFAVNDPKRFGCVLHESATVADPKKTAEPRKQTWP